MPLCPNCGSEMKPLISSFYCPNNCDRKRARAKSENDDDSFYEFRIGEKVRVVDPDANDHGAYGIVISRHPYDGNAGLWENVYRVKIDGRGEGDYFQAELEACKFAVRQSPRVGNHAILDLRSDCQHANNSMKQLFPELNGKEVTIVAHISFPSHPCMYEVRSNDDKAGYAYTRMLRVI